MPLNRTRFLAAAALVAGLLSASSVTRAASETDLAAAEDTITTLHAALVEVASSESTQSERYERLRPVIQMTHDLSYIAELTIRRQWRALDGNERDAFAAAFEHLSVMTYVTRFGAIGADSFKIHAAEASTGGRIEVHAAIVPADGDEIPLDYLLHDDDGEWRIVNILANRVSDLALKRSQYQRVLSDGTIDDLIDYLESEAERL